MIITNCHAESGWAMRFGVVVVTYNRLDKLKKCLEAYENQTYSPEVVLVIDNASTDGTSNYLDQWVTEEKEGKFLRKVSHNEQNAGGAGGFAEGVRQIQQFDMDWIWLADDDAYPETNCLAVIADYYERLDESNRNEISSICAQVIDNNGILSPLHRRIICKSCLQIKEFPIADKDYGNSSMEIKLFSFVGVAIKTSAVRTIGLPRGDYFIFFDDSEYALRIQKCGKIIYVPAAKIVHDSPENMIQRYSWKNYYMFRNKIYTYLQYFPIRYTIVEIIKTSYMIFRYYNCAASWKQFARALCDIQQKRMGANLNYLPIGTCDKKRKEQKKEES